VRLSTAVTTNTRIKVKAHHTLFGCSHVTHARRIQRAPEVQSSLTEFFDALFGGVGLPCQSAAFGPS
jgi:hypothetical protein